MPTCHMDVTTDEVREATQSHASESLVPGEGRSPNGPADEEYWKDTRKPMRYGEKVLAPVEAWPGQQRAKVGVDCRRAPGWINEFFARRSGSCYRGHRLHRRRRAQSKEYDS
jgi:hypothetical protein